MLKLSIRPIPTMIPKTINIQFLVIGVNALNQNFEERINFRCLPTFTAAELRAKKEEIRQKYQRKGCLVNIYTVSPNLKK